MINKDGGTIFKFYGGGNSCYASPLSLGKTLPKLIKPTFWTEIATATLLSG